MIPDAAIITCNPLVLLNFNITSTSYYGNARLGEKGMKYLILRRFSLARCKFVIGCLVDQYIYIPRYKNATFYT